MTKPSKSGIIRRKPKKVLLSSKEIPLLKIGLEKNVVDRITEMTTSVIIPYKARTYQIKATIKTVLKKK